MQLREVGEKVASRRHEIGLTITQLAKLAGLSRRTVSQLEQGHSKEIGFQKLQILLGLLGLSFSDLSTASRARKRGLWMATQNTNVSYKSQLALDELCTALLTGVIPTGKASNIRHFLDETPLALVTMAIEEAGSTPIERKVIWRNVRKLAVALQADRSDIWT